VKRKPRHRDYTLALRLIGKARAHQSREPLPVDHRRTLSIGYHGALESMTKGRGTEDDADMLALASNVALLLCEQGFGPNYLGEVKKAQTSLMALQGRFSQLGRYVLDGAGLGQLQTLLELHDAQLAEPDCTEGLLAAALSEIRRRMGAGNTLAAKIEERLGA
jgi:hypothetical protein